MSVKSGKSPELLCCSALRALVVVSVLFFFHSSPAFSLQAGGGEGMKINAEGKFPKDVNPHDQINDEGELKEDTCLFCHDGVPDIKSAESIENVKFLFNKFKDLKEMCFTCHPERMHPGGGTFASADPRWKKWGAPNHWVKPTEIIEEKLDSMLSETEVVMPLDPKTGEITCATCHNPHEIGVLRGAANVGADGNFRIRKLGKPVCLMCHDL